MGVEGANSTGSASLWKLGRSGPRAACAGSLRPTTVARCYPIQAHAWPCTNSSSHPDGLASGLGLQRDSPQDESLDDRRRGAPPDTVHLDEVGVGALDELSSFVTASNASTVQSSAAPWCLVGTSTRTFPRVQGSPDPPCLSSAAGNEGSSTRSRPNQASLRQLFTCAQVASRRGRSPIPQLAIVVPMRPRDFRPEGAMPPLADGSGRTPGGGSDTLGKVRRDERSPAHRRTRRDRRARVAGRIVGKATGEGCSAT